MSDNISQSQVRLGLIPALTDNILRLQQTPVTRKRQLSPQSEISRLNEEKERSKRRRDENNHNKGIGTTEMYKTYSITIYCLNCLFTVVLVAVSLLW